MIRKAKTSDNRQIAELCYLIWRDMELDITKEITKDRIIEAIELSIVNVRYRGCCWMCNCLSWERGNGF